MTQLDEAMDRSADLLWRALHQCGYVASPSFDHYAALWSRDAAIICLGASRSGDRILMGGVETSVRSLANIVSPLGQIPAAWWPDRGYWDWGEAGTTDATAWFVIALAEHVEVTGRTGIAEELWDSVVKGLEWLACQDVTGTRLVDSPAGGDWMDSSLNRSGRVFHVNVLYHWAASGAARLAGRLGREVPVDPEPIADAIDGFFWPAPGSDLAALNVSAASGSEFTHPLAAAEHARLAVPDRRHYLASVSYGRFVDRCDVLAHCLAIALGLVTGERAAAVLDYLDETGAATPFPSRTWPEPFDPADRGGLFDPHADALQDIRWRNTPGSYHNGAAWPYVGGAHAVAAATAGRLDRAQELLEGVAAANELDGWGFHEWIQAPTGAPAGARDQTWNGGSLLWAHSVVTAG